MNKSKKSLTGGKVVVQALKKENVSQVFGLIGSATMEIFDGLYHEKKIKFVDVRDERTGTHMADGYARASNQPGIIIAGQNGPGATNLVTGIAQAKAAFSPVVALAGSCSTKDKIEDAFQGLDQQTLFKPITKKTWTVKKVKKIPKILESAFKLSMKPTRGPVCINLPRNILAEKSAFNLGANKSYKNEYNIKGKLKAIKKSAKLIAKSKKPVIIVGAGIKNNGKYVNVISFSKSLNIPIVASAGHGDAIPFDYKLYAGQMGPRGNQVATNLVKESDLILALGTRLGFNSTFYSYENINRNAKIIHVELEKKMIGRYFPITVGIYGDASTVISQIHNEIKNQKILSNVDIWTNNFIKNRLNYLKQRDIYKNNNSIIQPKGLFKELRSILPVDTAITLDAGTLCLQATDAFEFYKPPALFTPLDFGLVGFSFACGLGVKIAKPKKTVVSLMGDGGFGMTISELSTAVQYKINTITIVMNNKSWGAEKAYQKDFFDKRYLGADIKSPPFDKVAKIYGAEGFKVSKISDLYDAIKLGLKSNKPVVIDVDVDPKALYSFRRDSFKHKEK